MQLRLLLVLELDQQDIPPLVCAGTLSLTSRFSCVPSFSFCCPDYRVSIALLSRGSGPGAVRAPGQWTDAVMAIRRTGRAGGTGCSSRALPRCLSRCRGSRCGSLCPLRPLSPRLRATAPAWARFCPGCGPWAGAAPPGPTCLGRLERGRRAVAAASLPSSPSSLPLPAPPRLSLGPLGRDSLQVGAGTAAEGQVRAARGEPAGKQLRSVLLGPSHRRGFSAPQRRCCPAAGRRVVPGCRERRVLSPCGVAGSVGCAGSG